MKRYLIAVVLMLAAGSLSAQHMFDYSDIRSGKFQQKTVRGVRSMNDGEHYTIVSGGKIEKYSYKTGQKTATLFDSSEHELPGGGFYHYELSPDETRILLSTNVKPIYRRSYTADHYVYNINDGKLQKLTEQGGEQVPAFSPQSDKVAYVRKNNLYYMDLVGPRYEYEIITNGRPSKIINGHTDWVYEEEFGFTRAFEWSPDGNTIAYLSFDERLVPEVTITRFTGALYPEPLVFKYPKAGERNSVIEMWLYNIVDGSSEIVDMGTEKDQYIPRIGFTPNSEPYFYRTNRLQNHFEVLISDLKGKTRVVYEEKDRRYVERQDDETITFLPKGDRFVVKNETSGNMHLYLYSTTKGVIDTLTRGRWDVTNFLGADNDRAYYISSEGSPLRRNFYSVRLNGKGKTRLTQENGTFSVSPSKNFRYFISFFSNTTTPTLVRLHDGSGKVLRVLEDNIELQRTIHERKVPAKEFFTFTTERGTVLNGYMIRPSNFDQTKKYPVLMTQYSGPGSQQVLDRWSIDWTDVMVQEGYIVVCVDGRGTGCRGADFKKVTYCNLGGPEVEDQISAAKYLATQPYVDMSRIGIYGWSYGGFMALNCILKGNDVFKTAIAVAPVTSWRYYDTIYTEIYNGLPQDNPRGYDDNSPINYADRLKGNLLIVHGSADDNVHPQNTFSMVDALVKNGKKFDLMIYPDDNHSMVPTGRHHIMEKMIDYTLKNL